MFPDLAPKLKDAARIEIVHQGKTTVIVKHDGVWGVEDRGGYVVQATKLRGMLTALTELRLVEPRTNDPAEFSRLGLEDPNGKSAEFESAAGAGCIGQADRRGDRRATAACAPRAMCRSRSMSGGRTTTRPGWRRAVCRSMPIPQLWLDRDIMNIDHARIASVAVTTGDETLEFARDGQKLALKQPADHPQLDDYKLDDVDRALELLTLPGRADRQGAGRRQDRQSVFTTDDGLAVTATVFNGDKDIWARFAA